MSSEHTVKNPIVCAELAAFVITVKPVYVLVNGLRYALGIPNLCSG